MLILFIVCETSLDLGDVLLLLELPGWKRLGFRRRGQVQGGLVKGGIQTLKGMRLLHFELLTYYI